MCKKMDVTDLHQKKIDKIIYLKNLNILEFLKKYYFRSIYNFYFDKL